jgi:hypothetical protein
LPLLVHIAPENKITAIRRNGIAPRRLRRALEEHPECDRLVWAFPVLPSYTLTHSWARELKRLGATALAAITFRVASGEPVLASHFSAKPPAMTAAEATGIIRAASDPRGYEIMVPRRIRPWEIIRAQPLPRAIGWRYWPDAHDAPMRLCDCPMCMPRGEVKAKRYRGRVKARMKRAGIRSTDED